MRARSIRRGALAATTLSAVLLAGPAAAAAAPSAAPVAPASGHAQVIAQGVVSFTAGAHHWRLVTNDVRTERVTVDTASPTFLVAASGALDAAPVRLTEPDGLGWVLADGEAAFRPADSVTTIEPSAGALVHEIAVDAGEGADAFDPGEGLRDLDLVRDVLATGESLTVRSDVSALIFVTAGVATAADGSAFAAGTTRAVVGETTVSNGGAEPVVVLAAIVGSRVDAGESAPPPADDGSEDDGPAPTQPPTTIDPTLDTDGDGLTDADEINIYGTNPNTYDTDGDTVSDYLEAKDGYSDPFNPDTDGDGYNDAEQFDGYDPRDPNSHPGATTTTAATSPPPPASSTP